MKQIAVVVVCLLLISCSGSNSFEEEYRQHQSQWNEEEKEEKRIIQAALSSGELTTTTLYYRPNLNGERWFKVEDQYGCMWWIDSGHKFDHKQLDVNDKGVPNCKDQKYAPEPSTVYLDRAGNTIDIYDFVVKKMEPAK